MNARMHTERQMRARIRGAAMKKRKPVLDVESVHVQPPVSEGERPRVVGALTDGQEVLLGYIEKPGNTWQAWSPNLVRLPKAWRYRRQAVVALAERYQRGEENRR